MTTDDRTTAALKDSIEHWKRLEKLYDNEDASGIDSEGYGAESCPLCLLFAPPHVPVLERELPPCEGCPVMDATGEEGCRKTPYYMAMIDLELGEAGCFREINDTAVPDERRFLESLLAFRQLWVKP